MNALVPVPSWTLVLLLVRRGVPLYYQAPLDRFPVRVQVRSLRHPARDNRTISPNIGAVRTDAVHVTPPGFDCDPFEADRDHLPRFRVEAGELAKLRPTRKAKS